MAVNSGWITALASGANAATAGTTTPQQQAQQGAQAQAWAAGINTLGDLAMGATRARMLKADAAGERVAGERRADRIRKAGDKAMGEVRSAAVASGVKLSSASVLDAEEDRRAMIAAFRERLAEIEHRLNALDDEIDTKVATAANSAVTILGKMQNGEAKRRGRPPTANIG